MEKREAIIKKTVSKLNHLPLEKLREIEDFVDFVKYRHNSDKTQTHIASSKSLEKDWLKPEEDEAWKDL